MVVTVPNAICQVAARSREMPVWWLLAKIVAPGRGHAEFQRGSVVRLAGRGAVRVTGKGSVCQRLGAS